ncbi:MAG: putative ammonium transporter [Methanomassiliicoccales archaeon PtaU1.Bin124]|nr:MAG: putative ammonium transporter [Methanomassiliicoccales archaeon PtaU1.Bin124]
MLKAYRYVLMLAMVCMGILALTPNVAAADSGTLDTGATAWMIVATALVFVMTPAVGFFYGGMLRKESFLSMLGQTLIITGMVTFIWVVFGYSLAFGTDTSGIIGGTDFLMLHNVDQSIMPTGIPHLLFMVFQMTFAIVTVALIIGGIAERMKLKALIVFLFIWTCLIYIPVAHWVWGGGWIMKMGALDFAGGTVVHITAGISTLAAAMILGKRISAQHGNGDHPHNIPMVVLGAGLLFFGWFGFNGGSAIGSNGLAVQALVNTEIAGAMAIVSWGMISYFHLGRPGVLGLASGAIAGLVAITPASGYVDTTGALVIGLAAGAVCYGGIQLRKKFGYDDALDVFGVHGIGGTFGAIATGLFATTAVNSAGANGLFYGGGVDLLVKQFIAVAAVWAFAFGVTYAILWVLKKVMPLRMTKDEERVGADIVQHGENAYDM